MAEDDGDDDELSVAGVQGVFCTPNPWEVLCEHLGWFEEPIALLSSSTPHWEIKKTSTLGN